MARRFLLVGLFRILYPGTITQLILATLLVTLHLVLQTQAQPFRNKSDSYLAMSVTISLFIELFCCNLYKFQELVDEVAAQDAQLNTQTSLAARAMVARATLTLPISPPPPTPPRLPPTQPTQLTQPKQPKQPKQPAHRGSVSKRPRCAGCRRSCSRMTISFGRSCRRTHRAAWWPRCARRSLHCTPTLS